MSDQYVEKAKKAGYRSRAAYKILEIQRKFKILDLQRTIYNYESGANTSIGQTTYNNLKVQLNKIKSILGNIE